jgi:hypothetical protein
MIMCRACQCSGFDLKQLGSRDARALGEYSKAIVRLIAKRRIGDALEKAQEYALGVRLTVPDTFLPETPDVAYLFPFSEKTEVPAGLENLWKSRDKAIEKINLLVDFGIYIARTLRPYRIHGQVSRTAKDVRRAAEEIPYTVPFPPERLSAFPGFYADRWVCARGTAGKKTELPGFRGLDFFTLKGEAPNDLVFSVWTPTSRIGAKKAGVVDPSLRHLRTFASSYPYMEAESFLKALEAGQEVEVFGRMLFRDGRWPRKVVEVWRGWKAGDEANGEAEAPRGPGTPRPGPLLDKSEDWIRKRSGFDRLVREGNGYLRRGMRAAKKADDDARNFSPWNEEAVTLLQKARAFYEKAWKREKAQAIEYLLDEVNGQILTRIETARSR